SAASHVSSSRTGRPQADGPSSCARIRRSREQNDANRRNRDPKSGLVHFLVIVLRGIFGPRTRTILLPDDANSAAESLIPSDTIRAADRSHNSVRLCV